MPALHSVDAVILIKQCSGKQQDIEERFINLEKNSNVTKAASAEVSLM